MLAILSNQQLNQSEMKKMLIFCICFLSLPLIAQESDIPYDFPVKPGTEQWAKLSSSRERDEACVIPDEVLKSLSTKALLITCLNYPRLADVFCADNLQKGFEFYSKHFDGLYELLNRSDLNRVLLDFYSEININNYRINSTNDKISLAQIAFFELLLSQNNILRNYDKSEIIRILSLAIKNLKIRKSKQECLSRQMTTALILARIINEIDNSSMGNALDNDVYRIFVSSGMILDITIIDKILMAAEPFDSNRY